MTPDVRLSIIMTQYLQKHRLMIIWNIASVEHKSNRTIRVEIPRRYITLELTV